MIHEACPYISTLSPTACTCLKFYGYRVNRKWCAQNLVLKGEVVCSPHYSYVGTVWNEYRDRRYPTVQAPNSLEDCRYIAAQE